MWFLILVIIVAACAAAYVFRVPLLAKVLGQPERRIKGHLKRKGD